jgi:AsmA protein
LAGLRRHFRVALLAVAGIILVALAGFVALIATRDFSGAPARLASLIARETGAEISIEGTELRYWPSPHLVLGQVRVKHAGKGFDIRAPRGEIRLDLLDLVDGSVDFPHLALDRAEISLGGSEWRARYASPRAVIEALDQISASFVGFSQLSGARLTLNAARIRFSDRDGVEQMIEPLDARMRYRARAGRIDVTARRNVSERPLDLSFSLPTHAALAQRDDQPVSVQVAGLGSRASLTGRMSRRPELAISGRFEASVREDFENWIGLSLHRDRNPAGVEEPTLLTGTLALDPRSGGLEGLTIARAGAQLTGIAAMRENAGRWGISATLAGDMIDGTATHRAFNALRQADGTWSRRALDVNPAPGLDLDIRLSTKQFRLGRLALEDAALSVFTRRGRAEFAIVDSRVGGGHLKARIGIVQRGNVQDVRLQASGDRIEAETLLDQAFGLNRLRGGGHFALLAETFGENIAELASNLQGSGSAEIRNGQITGVDANRLMSRVAEIRPEAALIASLGGRTPFELLSVHVAIREGRIEPVGSTWTAQRMIGLVEGGIDLTQQRHDLAIILRRKEVQPNLPSDFFAVKIDGPLFHPNLRPDPALLARRS